MNSVLPADRGTFWQTPAPILVVCAFLLPTLPVFDPLGLAPLFTVAAAAVLVRSGRRAFDAMRPIAPLAALLGLLSVWAMLSAAWSVIPSHSLFEGLRLSAISVGGVLLMSAALGLAPEDRWRIAYAAGAGLGLAVALLLIEAFSGAALTRLITQRAAIPMTRFDRAATTLVLALWPVVAALARRRIIERVAVVLAVAAATLALQSTTAVLAILVGALAFIIGRFAPRFVAGALCLGLVVLSFTLPLAVPDFRTLVALHERAPWIKWSGIHRLLIWRFTDERIADRPFLGWGMDASRALPGGKTHFATLFPDAGLPTDAEALPLHPHDAALQWRVELGIPGILLCLAIVTWGLWRNGFDRRRAPLTRAGALAWAASALVIALLSYGAWQAWWLSALFLSGAAYAGVIPPPGADNAARQPRPGPTEPRLLYIATEDWFFRSHFVPMARAAIDAGFAVALASRLGDAASAIAADGVRLIPLALSRSSLNPWHVLREIGIVTRLLRRERPDILHLIALKPILVGGIAARLAGTPNVVHAITGLGYLGARRDRGTALIRALLWPVLGLVLRQPNGWILVENDDDARAFGRFNAGRITQIGGAGVDPDHFAELPAPDGATVTAALVARMVWSKGADVAIEAQRLLRQRGVILNLTLVGPSDRDNPGDIPPETLQAWSGEPGIRWLGHQPDVRTVWRAADIAVVPSRGGEGMPRALLEAAACGRPIVATDVPGARSFVQPGKEGVIVPPDDPRALADALETLARDPALRRKMGRAARARVLSGYTVRQVCDSVVALYRMIVAPRAVTPGDRNLGARGAPVDRAAADR